ncbi:MAG: hypothetical protein JWM68_2713 [Verrucomicrobiales bacterium]|nr:hypothetical protein [Verrucomicrobiales bacterium]
MKKTLLKLAVIALLAAFVAAPVRAQDKKDEKPAASAEGKKAAPKGMPFHGKLSAVDETAKTITVAGKEKDRTFFVTSKTKIIKDNKPATLSDAKVGDEVGGYAVMVGDKAELGTLRVGPKPEGKADEHKAAHKKSEKSDK